MITLELYRYSKTMENMMKWKLYYIVSRMLASIIANKIEQEEAKLAKRGY